MPSNTSYHCRLCEVRAKQHQVTAMREAGKTFREIGEQLGISSTSAHRSYKRLREHSVINIEGEKT